MTKCDSCLNSRQIVSENGMHYVCGLSHREASNCVFSHYKYYIEHPAQKYVKNNRSNCTK